MSRYWYQRGGDSLKTKLITEEMLEACQQKSLEVATYKQFVIKETWKTFLNGTIKMFADQRFREVDIESFIKLGMPTTMKQWRMGLMDKKAIPYVAASHKVAETLCDAVFAFEPARSLAEGVDKVILRKEYTNPSHVGFGQYRVYHKEPPLNNASIGSKYYNNSNCFKDIWSLLPLTAYLELFQWVAPFKGGLHWLKQFAKTDSRYMEPVFIAAIILAPVKKIVSCIMEIMSNNNMFSNSQVACKSTSEKNKKKTEIALLYWYTLRYLQVLSFYGPPKQLPLDPQKEKEKAEEANMEEILENDHKQKQKKKKGKASAKKGKENKQEKQSDPNDLYGFQVWIDDFMGGTPTFVEFGLLPMILYHMPREFIRWKEVYGEEGAPCISKKWDEDDDEEQDLVKPSREYWMPRDVMEEHVMRLSEDNSDDPDDPDYTDPDTMDQGCQESTGVVQSVADENDPNEEEEVDEFDSDGVHSYMNVFEPIKNPQYTEEVHVEIELECWNNGNDEEIDGSVDPGPGPEYSKFQPFDVSKDVHRSIRSLAAGNWTYKDRNDPSGQTELLIFDQVYNHKEWDPLFICQGMMNGVFDFTVADFHRPQQESKSNKVKHEEEVVEPLPKRPKFDDNDLTRIRMESSLYAGDIIDVDSQPMGDDDADISLDGLDEDPPLSPNEEFPTPMQEFHHTSEYGNTPGVHLLHRFMPGPSMIQHGPLFYTFPAQWMTNEWQYGRSEMMMTTGIQNQYCKFEYSLAFMLTIKTCFSFLYEHREENWAKQTLNGLNMILNAGLCCEDPYPQPGQQQYSRGFSMEFFNPDNPDNKDAPDRSHLNESQQNNPETSMQELFQQSNATGQHNIKGTLEQTNETAEDSTAKIETGETYRV